MFKDPIKDIYAKNFLHTHLQGYLKIRNFSPGLKYSQLKDSTKLY